MSEVFEAIVKRYARAACNAAGQRSSGSGVRDEAAIRAMSDAALPFDERVAELAGWIRLYKVHRVKWHGGEGNEDVKFADIVAKTAIEHFASRQSNAPIPQQFLDLREAIGAAYGRGAPSADADSNKSAERSFLSLTSKVLWCRYPDAVPIYDQFAEQAIRFLVKVYKSSAEPAEVYVLGAEKEAHEVAAEGWRSWSRARQDSWWYADFYNSHSILFSKFAPIIEREKGAATAPTFRIFDKLLWIFGNGDLDFSFGPEHRWVV